MSVRGAAQLHERLDDRSRRLADVHTQEVDSLRRYYGQQVATLEQRIAGIEQHKGKRWGGLLSGSENRQILNYQAQISQVQEKEAAALASLQAGQASAMAATQEQAGFHLVAVVVLAALVDLFIILCAWYAVYFDYQTAKESDALHQAQKVSVSLEDLQTLVGQYVLGRGDRVELAPAEVVAQKNSIGFSLGQQLVSRQETEKKPGQSSASGLLAAIRSGCRDYRKLMRDYRVNVSTVKAAIDKVEREEG
jgi:hypothetical protein